jgi:hypothetical protein
MSVGTMWIHVSPGRSPIAAPDASAKRKSSSPDRFHVPSMRMPSRRMVTSPLPVDRKSSEGAPVTSAVPGISVMSVLMMTTFVGETSAPFAASFVGAPLWARFHDEADHVYVTFCDAVAYGSETVVVAVPPFGASVENWNDGRGLSSFAFARAASRALAVDVYAL